jgi:hypothetical protein
VAGDRAVLLHNSEFVHAVLVVLQILLERGVGAATGFRPAEARALPNARLDVVEHPYLKLEFDGDHSLAATLRAITRVKDKHILSCVALVRHPRSHTDSLFATQAESKLDGDHHAEAIIDAERLCKLLLDVDTVRAL